MDAIFGGDSIRIRPSYGTVYQENITYHLTYSGEFYSIITRFRGLISPSHFFLLPPLHLRYDFQCDGFYGISQLASQLANKNIPTVQSTYNTVSTPNLVRLQLHTYVHCSSIRIQVCMKYCNCIQYTPFFFQEPSDTTNLVQKLHIHARDKECLQVMTKFYRNQEM